MDTCQTLPGRRTIVGFGVTIEIPLVSIHGYAILPGNPLCDVSQYTRVASTFLKRLKGERFYQKSMLMLVGPVYKMYQAPGLVGRRLQARLKSVLMLQIDRVA